jgi:hypothetical protein
VQHVNLNLKVNFDIDEKEIVERLKEFLDNEARSGFMDYGCITPLYVCRMFVGQYTIEDIEGGLNYLKENNYGY